jgi:hypothetical protein
MHGSGVIFKFYCLVTLFTWLNFEELTYSWLSLRNRAAKNLKQILLLIICWPFYRSKATCAWGGHYVNRIFPKYRVSQKPWHTCNPGFIPGPWDYRIFQGCIWKRKSGQLFGINAQTEHRSSSPNTSEWPGFPSDVHEAPCVSQKITQLSSFICHLWKFHSHRDLRSIKDCECARSLPSPCKICFTKMRMLLQLLRCKRGRKTVETWHCNFCRVRWWGGKSKQLLFV